jgi:hypothetical protein
MLQVEVGWRRNCNQAGVVRRSRWFEVFAVEGSRLTVLLGDCAVKVGEEDELESRGQFSSCGTQSETTYLGVCLHGGKVRGSILNTHLELYETCVYVKGRVSEDVTRNR